MQPALAPTESLACGGAGPCVSIPAMSKPRSPFASLEALREKLPPGEAPPSPEPEPQGPYAWLARAKVVLREERKGRGGKTVTVLERVPEAALEALALELKRALGCAASVEDSERGRVLVLHGKLLERARAWLAEHTPAKG